MAENLSALMGNGGSAFTVTECEDNQSVTSLTETMQSNNSLCPISVIPENNMTTLEQKKKKAMADIQEVERELNQLDKDAELRELQKRQQELKALLERKRSQGEASTSSPVKSKKTSKKKVIGKSGDPHEKRMKEIDLNELLYNDPFEQSVKETGEDIQSKLPSFTQIQDALYLTGKKNRNKRQRRTKKRSQKKPMTSSDSSSESSDADSSSGTEDSSDEDDKSFKRRKGTNKSKSGLFAKAANARIVSSELFAHAALDADFGVKDPKDLSFHLLVAGELEIISDSSIKIKERETRIEVLKALAYKREYLSETETVKQYAGFMNKIEWGKFKWGSRKDLRTFEQQLMFSITVESRNGNKFDKSKNKQRIFEDRTKYCLDFNRGTCKLEKPHEGKINGQTVTKYHICRRCLVEDNKELPHAEKDCKNK